MTPFPHPAPGAPCLLQPRPLRMDPALELRGSSPCPPLRLLPALPGGGGGKPPLPEEGNKRQRLCSSLLLLTLLPLTFFPLALRPVSHLPGPTWALGTLCRQQEGRLAWQDAVGQSLPAGRPSVVGLGRGHGLGVLRPGPSGPWLPQLG